MEPRPLSYVADACQGRWERAGPDVLITSVATDSRRIGPGELFVALVGEQFDGHDFLAEVEAKGAVAAVVERGRGCAARFRGPLLEVDETRAALGRLAARYRSGFNLPVIAVGGSNGKTTTKELAAAALAQGRRVLRSPASYNNDIGVPLTLLQLDRSHGAAVIEVGTNHPGELAPLVRMVQPQLGVLTSLGREHLGHFGGMEGVVREEGWLAELLPAHGKLFLEGDGPWTDSVRARAAAETVRAGFGPGNEWQATDVRMDEGGTRFRVRAPERHFSGEYQIQLLGRHQVTNALLALAVAEECGSSPEEARRGLAQCGPARMRMELRRCGAVRVLDDSYNANADSVAAALTTLAGLECAGRRWAVLGDMAELGEYSEAAHEEAGRRAADAGIGRLVAVGRWAGVTAGGARRAGLEWVREFEGVDLAAAEVPAWVEPGDLVLVKGSRVSRLERFVSALQRHFGDATSG